MGINLIIHNLWGLKKGQNAQKSVSARRRTRFLRRAYLSQPMETQLLGAYQATLRPRPSNRARTGT